MFTHLRRQWCAALIFGLVATCVDAQPDRIVRRIEKSSTAVLTSATHPHARPQHDLGSVEESFPLDGLTLHVKPSASQERELRKLLREQQDPASPNYHKWLTPEQYGARFGISQSDVEDH
jgi:hypothetical protein